ncbi:MAG: OmpA family protein [Gammaproteobacteria bacterium]|nr:OmpA family protein [Gammaproteobacteria bacterium]NND61203.1 OmpA family protein [Gammaproteobacteria bacterium]
MNKLIPVLILCASSSVAFAADEQPRAAQSVGVGGGAVVGAIAGGPVGAIIGAAIGGHYADSLSRSAKVPGLKNDLATTQTQLNDSQARIASLDRSLFETRSELSKLGEEMSELLLERAVFEGLQMEVMYPTATAELSTTAADRLQRLAELLQQIPEMTVRLDGYADPRGAEGYNEALSLQRAESVRDTLIAAGVATDRISLYAHGEAASSATDGDLDAYALDRRVRIRLFATPPASRQVAQQD